MRKEKNVVDVSTQFRSGSRWTISDIPGYEPKVWSLDENVDVSSPSPSGSIWTISNIPGYEPEVWSLAE